MKKNKELSMLRKLSKMREDSKQWQDQFKRILRLRGERVDDGTEGHT